MKKIPVLCEIQGGKLVCRDSLVLVFCYFTTGERKKGKRKGKGKEKDEGNLKKSEALACDVMMAAITSAKSE